MNIDIQKVVPVALKAGEIIMEIYGEEDFQIETKADHSPLTMADKASHEIIQQELKKLYPGIPVLSEEGKSTPYSERKNWPVFWLVDPLDGTKEFIRRNGEFTVNIALIEKHRPVLGVMAAPALDVLYFAQKGEGAFKQSSGNAPEKIRVDSKPQNGLIAVKSRSHATDEEEAFFNRYQISDSVSVGSALKFCMVAEGRAHVYYRHGPTWEWDTGAGHVIAECAGAMVYHLEYNKENLLNASFLVSSVEAVQMKT